MPIFYCLVANAHCALAECRLGGDAKLQDIAQKLLLKLDYNQDSVESVDCDGKTFCYRVENGVVCVCVTNAAFGKSAAVLFVRHIQQLFDKQFGIRGKMTKLRLDMNREFAPTLRHKMEVFSSEQGTAKLEELKKDLEMVKEQVQESLGKTVDRGDKIELLVDKTEMLNSQSAAFADASKKLRRHMWMQNMKMMIAIGVLSAVVLVLVVVSVKKKLS